MADFSRSVQRTQAATPTLSKKISNGNGFTAKSAYDDVFGGPPKFGVPTFSSRIDDYNEIFGNFHASRASSIPILDLPVVDERDVLIDVRSTKFDYSEVFGGFNGFDFAISYEDLLADPKGGGNSSDDVWTPAETGSASEGSSEDPVCSENNQSLLDEESHQSCSGTKQFNLSFHKTNQLDKDDVISATTHIAQLDSVPAFTFVVDENIPLEKTEEGKPFSQETKACESSENCSVGVLDGNNLQEAISQQVGCHTVAETSESNLKPQITPDGYGSFFNEEFLTVAEISLRTRPSHVPPPSRPPPNLAVKKEDSKKLAASRLRDSENLIGGRAASEDSPFFDVEVDASSSAAASAAAMKEAMDKAQARLKSAKESMDRKRDGLQNRKKLGLKDDLTSRERKEGGATHEARRQKEKARETFEREDDKVKYSAVEMEVVPDIVVRGLVHASKELVEQNHVKESKSTQESRKQEDRTGEWKVQEEYYELVKMDKFRAASEVTKLERERELMPTQQVHESEKVAVTMVFDHPDENDKMLKTIEAAPAHDMGIAGMELEVDREACTHEEHQKKINYVEEVHELKEHKKEQVKNEMGSCEGEEHEKRLKEALEWEEHEQKLIEIRQREENEKAQKAAREHEESQNRERVEREREVNAKRLREASEKEENEKRLKEVLELEEVLKRQKEAHAREENEIRLKKAWEFEENEKRQQEARELEESEKRRKEALDLEKIESEKKLEEAHAREENEKKMYESREREETEKRLNEARERNENEKRRQEAQEREEIERIQQESRIKDEIERIQQESRIKEEIERREQEARETEENERRQQEAREKEDNERRLEAAVQKASLPTNECTWKTSRKSTESDESEENLKSAEEVCKQDGGKKLEFGQLSWEPEATGKMTETARQDSGHKDNQKKLKPSEKLANEEDFNNMLQEAHVNRTAFEHKESENKKKVASNAKLHDIEKSLGESEVTIRQGKIEKIHKTDQVVIKLEANKVNCQGAQGMPQLVEKELKLEAAHPSFVMEHKRDGPRVPHEVNINQDVEPEVKNLKEVLVMEEKVKEENMQKERELVKERLRKAEEDKERERVREKDRMAVERATREARERALADVRERAERAAVERATAEARQRAMAEARERAEKASAEARQKASVEAREKLLAEKVSTEARLRLERAAVERATAEARERAVEKAMADNAALGARGRAERTYSEKFSATSRDSGMKHSSSFNDLRDSQFQSSNSSSSSQRYPNSSTHGASHVTERFQGVETETAQRCKARLERHQRTVERAAKALEEKNIRDRHTQREQAERNRLADVLDADVKRWSTGKEGNLRALLSTLQYILGPDSGWQPIHLTEVITAVAVKKAYRKATLCVHPDKLQQRGATIHQKYICEKVFDLLKEAWNKFNSEER